VLCERGRNIVKERHGGTWCLRKGEILTTSFIPSYTLSSIMASYAEDILHAAREASGPSIRDFESIKCFQSHPTTKDAVCVSFYPF
jgi:hypothetical protein